jgi:TPR repeat protein
MTVEKIIKECLQVNINQMEQLCMEINSRDTQELKHKQIKEILGAVKAHGKSGSSLYCLAMMHEFGLIEDVILDGVETTQPVTDSEETAEDLPDEEAQARVAIREEQRLGRARSYYQQAVEDYEHTPSTMKLAKMIGIGEGGYQSVDEAITLFESVQQTGTRDERALATREIESLIKYKDINIKRLLSGALNGDQTAAYDLSNLTKTVLGTTKLRDFGQMLARKLEMSEGDETQDAVLAFARARLLESATHGLNADDSQFIQAYNTAIELKSADAMVRLAEIYIHGEYNIEVDEDAAIRLLENASKAVESPEAAKKALRILVTIYQERDNAQQQVNHLRTLCRYGDGKAMLELALLYHSMLSNINNTTLDPKKYTPKMIKTFILAANAGESKAYFMLGEIFKSGFPEVRADLGKAIYYYYKALSAKNEDAQSIDLDDLKRTYAEQKETRLPDQGTPPEDTICDSFLDIDVLIETRRKRDKKLDDLFLSISALTSHSEMLPTDSKGKTLASLAKQLEQKLTSFILELADEHTTADKKDANALDRFKKDFKDTIIQHSKDLQGHRAKWKPMLANILIALTGVGLAALLGRAVIVALFSDKKNTNTFNKYAFFGETTSEALSRKVEKSLDAEIEVLRKTPAPA